MSEIALTLQQQDAVEWVLDRFAAGKKTVAIVGLAGTGKTALFPHLRAMLEAKALLVTVGAPTHRAAMVLRSKGLEDADTVHSLALTPSFAPDYARAVAWLGGQATARPSAEDIAHPDVQDVPYLIAEYCVQDLKAARGLRAQRNVFSAQRLLDSLGIRGQDYFREFLPRGQSGCLILDEASMVDEAMLFNCQQAFPYVCLVGDPGQLGPVEGKPVLHLVEAFTLTEIHRQAADSPIVQLAYRARRGEPFWKEALQSPGGEIATVRALAPEAFLHAPLLVYRNHIRIDCVKRIRAALGYPPDRLVPGEPLVCRTTDSSDKALGFYNNAMFTVVAVTPAGAREVLVRGEDGGEHTILVHLEELDGPKKDPKAIWFRFAYALTVHTSQGGEWPTGYISQPELRWWQKKCVEKERLEEFHRWSYTAITRAKQALVFVATHTFVREGAPVMADATSRDLLADPLHDPPELVERSTTPPLEDALDDIPEPIVPATLLKAVTPEEPSRPLAAVASFGEHEALLHGFCQHLQKRLDASVMDQHKQAMRVLDSVTTAVKDWIEGKCLQSDHASYQLSGLLEKLMAQGVQVRHDPYQASVQALSPQGFVVQLHLRASTTGAVVEELPQMLGWMKEQGYQPVEVPASWPT